MAKLKGAAKQAFLRRMRLGRLKKNRQSNKQVRSRSRSTMARTRLKQIIRHRGKSMNLKKEATKAGLGVGIGLAIKYGLGYLARGNPQMSELARRGANVGAAFGGVPGELAYQAADYAVNQIVSGQGGMPAGAGAGEAA